MSRNTALASIVGIIRQFAPNDERHIQDEQCNDDITNRRGQPSRRQHLVNSPQHEGHSRDQSFEELNGMCPESWMKGKPRQTDQDQRNAGCRGMKTMARKVGEAI